MLFLSPSWTAEPCSLETWFDWTDSPQYDPLLAWERLDDHVLALTFTGHRVGLPGKSPHFFTVTVTHPRHAEQEWAFETFAETREGLRLLLEERLAREVNAYAAQHQKQQPLPKWHPGMDPPNQHEGRRHGRER